MSTNETIELITPSLTPREQVWTTAWAAVAAAITCREASAATRWADDCLRDFDTRFPDARSAVRIAIVRDAP